MSRTQYSPEIDQYVSDWIYEDVATSEGTGLILEKCSNADSVSLVFCCGNHGHDASIANQIGTYQTNLVGISRIWEMTRSNPSLNINCIIICSSLMGSLPDRHFPFYAASKAGLDHFIRSIRNDQLQIPICSIVLGPVGSTNARGMTPPDKVAKYISGFIKKPYSGEAYLPRYLKVLIPSIRVMPNFWERILVGFRKRRN